MATMLGGYMGKVLKIDLSQRTISEYPWSDEERELYLGGKIMAAKIIYDNLSDEVAPLSSENMIVISTGPLTNTGAPSSSRFNVSGLSPATGILASSNCGGDFGMKLKRAGYDALILIGRADKKTWIEITESDVKFHDAESLWGMKVGEVQAALPPKTGKLVIGPAGENLVNFAGLFSGERAAGRCGLGAVMGFKNVKAITADGRLKPEIKNPDKFKAYNKKWIASLRKHPVTGSSLPELGTAGLISTMQSTSILATKNFQYGKFDQWEAISGETLAEKHLIKNKGCITCPIQCGRVVEVDGKAVKGPELETLGLFGANILNDDIESIFKWNYEADELGMDTISLAGVVAFSMELKERGVLDAGVEFGRTEGISELFEEIAYRRGIGDDLANGVKWMSEKYGGKSFAIHSKGLEISAYEPRASVGQGLGYAVSNRGGCHLNAGYLVLIEALNLNIGPYDPRNKAELSIMFQNQMEAVSAAGCCLFTVYTMLPGKLLMNRNSGMMKTVNHLALKSGVGSIVHSITRNPKKFAGVNTPLLMHSKALELITGMKMSMGVLLEIGDRGYNLERLYNTKVRGIDRTDDSLPSRLTDELQNPDNPNSKVPLESMKDQYYKRRQWDSDGLPSDGKLEKLKLIPEKG